MTRGQRTAVYIGGVFGFVYLMINSQQLPSPVDGVVETLAVLAFVGLLIAARQAILASRRAGIDESGGGGADIGFGPGYWRIVAAEVVAILAGLAVLSGPLDAPHAMVAWISVVVGVHFLGFYGLWHRPVYLWLGLGVALCGVAGLAVRADGLSAALIPIVAGILPGMLLFAFCYWRVARVMRDAGAPGV
jgi:hypothetical protein